KVRVLYCQMVGRGTRLAPGKDHLLLLDFLWHTEKHDLCRPACLICEDQEVMEKMTRNLEASTGVPMDIEEAENKASAETVADREAKLAEQLETLKKRKSKLVDPLQYEMSICSEELSGYKPAFGWETQPPTESQKKSLEKKGIDPAPIESAGKAEQILRALAHRQQEGLSTPKQIRCLEKYGFMHVGGWQFEAAKNMIDRIAANGWKVPHSVTPGEYVPQKTEVNANADEWIFSV
ncbi:MAG: DEAD/DEAH box helicase, partial [Ruminococcus sp.]